VVDRLGEERERRRELQRDERVEAGDAGAEILHRLDRCHQRLDRVARADAGQRLDGGAAHVALGVAEGERQRWDGRHVAEVAEERRGAPARLGGAAAEDAQERRCRGVAEEEQRLGRRGAEALGGRDGERLAEGRQRGLRLRARAERVHRLLAHPEAVVAERAQVEAERHLRVAVGGAQGRVADVLVRALQVVG